jgi:putative DNA primase/helicase
VSNGDEVRGWPEERIYAAAPHPRQIYTLEDIQLGLNSLNPSVDGNTINRAVADIVFAGLGPVNEDRCFTTLAKNTKTTKESILASADMFRADLRRQKIKAVSPEDGGDLIDLGAPLATAKQYIARFATVAGRQAIYHYKDGFYAYTGARYAPLTDQSIRASLYRYLEKCWFIGEEGEPQPVKPNAELVSSVADALRAAAHLDDKTLMPSWLGDVPDLAAEEIIASRNTLLHLPTLSTIPHTPDFFTPNALDFDYIKDAPQPVQWLQFLNTLWPDDRASIDTLGEIFGYCLIVNTSQEKAFMLIGPPRCGKGTITKVLRRLVGEQNYAAPTLYDFSQPFGLQPLIDKRVAIIGDARLNGREDQDAIVERILSISGRDGMQVNRKNKTHWLGQLNIKFLILANLVPKLNDPSGALASRFIMLHMTQSFLGREDHGLFNRIIATELPGILNWSIEGLRRLTERGHFIQPAAAAEIVRQLDELSSGIRAFVRDRCEVAPGFSVAVDELFRAWQGWCGSQGRTKPGNKQSFGRDLKAAYPGIGVKQPREGGERFRQYEGIRLTGEGRATTAAQAMASLLDTNNAEPQREPYWMWN